MSEFNNDREISLRKRKYFHFCIAGFISSGVPKEDSRHFPRVADPPELPPGWFPRSLLAASCSEPLLASGEIELAEQMLNVGQEPTGRITILLMLFPQLRAVFMHFHVPGVQDNMCLLSYFDGGFVRMSLDW